MFGIDPEAIQNLAMLQKNIQTFMDETNARGERLETKIDDLIARVSQLEKERENA